MPVRLWNQLSTTDFQSVDRDQTLVLMPFGATEQHGPHLPVGTDHLIVEAVLKRVIPQITDLDALVLPTLWCTKSNEHTLFAGSLYLQAETLMAVVHDLAAAIARSGFKKLVFMNWHGGNTDLLAALARDVHQRHKLTVFVIDIVRSFAGLTDSAAAPSGPIIFDIHAGRYETGLMLAAHPELVKPGPYDNLGSDMQRGRLASSFDGAQWLLPEGGAVLVAWETHDLTPDGVIGNPAGATADEGEGNLNDMVGRVVTILREISRFEFRAT
jgi:creatinine amidohydrolase